MFHEFLGKFYEMASFVESKSEELFKTQRKQYEEHNKKHLTRIYPKGTRTDSSNYKPLEHWVVGCQLVALNYQTITKAMLFNDALFSLNGRCGYVLKPQFLRFKNNQSQDEQVLNIKPKKITLSIISGQHIPKPNLAAEGEVVDPYVKIKIYGHPTDCFEYKTIWVKNNGIIIKYSYNNKLIVYILKV